MCATPSIRLVLLPCHSYSLDSRSHPLQQLCCALHAILSALGLLLGLPCSSHLLHLPLSPPRPPLASVSWPPPLRLSVSRPPSLLCLPASLPSLFLSCFPPIPSLGLPPSPSRDVLPSPSPSLPPSPGLPSFSSLACGLPTSACLFPPLRTSCGSQTLTP